MTLDVRVGVVEREAGNQHVGWGGGGPLPPSPNGGAQLLNHPVDSAGSSGFLNVQHQQILFNNTAS